MLGGISFLTAMTTISMREALNLPLNWYNRDMIDMHGHPEEAEVSFFDCAWRQAEARLQNKEQGTPDTITTLDDPRKLLVDLHWCKLLLALNSEEPSIEDDTYPSDRDWSTYFNIEHLRFEMARLEYLNNLKMKAESEEDVIRVLLEGLPTGSLRQLKLQGTSQATPVWPSISLQQRSRPVDEKLPSAEDPYKIPWIAQVSVPYLVLKRSENCRSKPNPFVKGLVKQSFLELQPDANPLYSHFFNPQTGRVPTSLILTWLPSYFQANPGVPIALVSAADANLVKLFEKYRSKQIFVILSRLFVLLTVLFVIDDKNDEKDTVSMDGIMSYLVHLDATPDDISCLIVLEAAQATALGELTKEEFVKGWKDV